MLAKRLTPRQAAGLVGVSESTVRRWCDAGLVTATRTSGGHRRIERRALLAFARGQGLEILGLAPLATDGRGGRLPAAAELSERLCEQLLTGDERDVQQFTHGLLDRTGDTAGLCDDILAPAMHRIGESWARDRLRIFREHAATQRALSAVSAARSRLLASARAPSAVCAALPGDPYALAPAMCSLVVSAAGFRTTLLGPGAPADEIVEAAAALSAAVVTVSVSTPLASPEDLGRLCERLNELDIRVALGGRALTAGLRRTLRPDFFGDTMGHLSSYAERLMASLTSPPGGASGG